MSTSNADIAKMIEDASVSGLWPLIFLDSGYDSETDTWIVWLSGDFKDHKITIEGVRRPFKEKPVELW